MDLQLDPTATARAYLEALIQRHGVYDVVRDLSGRVRELSMSEAEADKRAHLHRVAFNLDRAVEHASMLCGIEDPDPPTSPRADPRP